MPAEHYSANAMAYASSVLDLANEQNQTDAVASDLSALCQAAGDSPEMRVFLTDPAISVEQRQAVLDKVTSDASPLTKNLIGVMNLKGRLGMLPEVAGAYERLLAHQRGQVDVEVTTAQPLAPEQVELVSASIGSALGKTPVVKLTINEDIIGGMLIRVGDKLIDTSVRAQLAIIRQRLLDRGLAAQRA